MICRIAVHKANSGHSVCYEQPQTTILVEILAPQVDMHIPKTGNEEFACGVRYLNSFPFTIFKKAAAGNDHGQCGLNNPTFHVNYRNIPKNSGRSLTLCK